MKIVYKEHGQLAEITQANPLRWKLMYKRGNTFTQTSSTLKCKDFFNDVVAYRKAGFKFNMYGFKNDCKVNKKGVWLELSHLVPEFEANIMCLNTALQLLTGHRMYLDPALKGDKGLLYIPEYYWASTYRISLLSMLIRCCNYETKYTDWESFFAEDKPLAMIETAWPLKTRNFAMKQGFINPKCTWAYAPGGWDAKRLVKEGASSAIHNNGVHNWAIALKV